MKTWRIVLAILAALALACTIAYRAGMNHVIYDGIVEVDAGEASIVYLTIDNQTHWYQAE